MTPVRIIIFAKAPQPGSAKTRLIPVLGAAGAAELARHMLHATLTIATEARLGPVELCGTPDFDHEAWQHVRVPSGVEITMQGVGDLGARLARAAARSVSRDEAVLLIGTDCPMLNVQRLWAAAGWLQNTDAVIYPTADGGYALLGLNCFDVRVFAGIPWSTPQVAQQTVARIRDLHWTLHQGDVLHDIDEPADLRHLPRAWQSVAAGGTKPLAERAPFIIH